MTIVTLRPSSVQYYPIEPLTVVGAANAILALTDDSDSSYVKATAGGMAAFLGYHFGTTSKTATQRYRSCRVKIRNARDGGVAGPIQPLTAAMYRDTDSTTLGMFDSNRGYPDIRTVLGPEVLSSWSNQEWTQADIDVMGASFMWFDPLSGTKLYQRLYEVYVDVDIRNQPVVSGQAASNYTNNAKPTISWNYADIDVEAQYSYRVKIFDATTIAGGGFSADTTPASWDSGDRVGTTQSVAVDRPLQAGVTYTAYVKASKLFRSAPWWSAWVTTSTFVPTYTAPYAPVIQSTAVIAGENQYRAIISTLVPVNLLTADNASFENGLGNWASLANCSIVRDTAQHADGVASMKMTSSGGDMTAVCDLDLIGNPRVDPLKTYTVVAQFRANAATRSCSVGVQWLKADTSIISTVYGGAVTDSAANFNFQASYSAAAPALAVYAKVVVKVASTAGGEIHWVDKVDIHAGSTAAWTPGGYWNDQLGLQVERGEFLVADRGPAENWCDPQVASGGSVLRSHGAGFGWWGFDSNLRWMWLDKALNAPGETPAGMIRWQLIGAAASTASIGIGPFGGWPYTTPAIAGEVHIFSCWAWVDTGTLVIRPDIHWLNNGCGDISTTNGSNVTLTTTPQRLSIYGTAPAGTIAMYGQLVNVNSATDKHIFFTRIGMGLGTVPLDGKKAMGNTPNGINWEPIKFLGLDNSLQFFSFPESADTGGLEILPDFEYPPGRPVVYRARISYGVDGNVVGSPDSSIVPAYGAPPTRTIIRSAVDPMLAVVVNRRKAASYTRVDDSQVFHPIGADRGPVKVRDWVGGEDGTMDVVTSTDAQAARLQAIIESGDVLIIQWAQGGRTFCLITGVSIAEVYSSDSTFCDADGTHLTGRFDVTSLTYIATVAP